MRIQPVAANGFDNHTFRLGKNLLVRLPSESIYAASVENEHKWLPKLTPFLPLKIPEPVATGHPSEEYPWKWSIYRWIEGDAALAAHIENVNEFAKSLGEFLIALQQIDSTNGPIPGPENFYRGGALRFYDDETRRAISALKDKIDVKAITEIWETALATNWQKKPVWVHGDISPGNLLVRNGHLHAVIDFGQMAIGDPACDLAIAWTFFKGKNREVFYETIQLDDATWARARGWVLWKALIVAAGFTNPNNFESCKCWEILENVLI